MLGGIGLEGEVDNRGWDGWIASPTRWTWVRVNFVVGDGQGGLAYCNSWGCKELDTSERLNWKSLLQYHSSKVSVLLCSSFFMIQLSYLYITTGKTIALTIGTFVGKVMCLLFNMLFRYVIAFLPRSKNRLISWLQSLSSVIFRANENKICLSVHFFPHLFAKRWWDGMSWS